MDNVEIQPIDNVDTLVDSGQSDGLLGYIQEQQFSPATAADAVNIDAQVAEQPVVQGEAQNVVAAATDQGNPSVVTPPAGSLDSLEKQRYERAIADLQGQVSTTRQQMLNVAAEARRREDAQFEASLSDMDETEARAARAEHKARRAEEAAGFFRDQYQQVRQSETQREQDAAKNLAAYKLANHLGLPISAVDTLMTAETTTGMLNMAKALRDAIPAQAQQQQMQVGGNPVVNPAVLAAGGSTAPAAPPKRTPQRSGNLIDMMRERPYVNVAVQ